MADLVPMSQAATTSLVTTLQNTDLFALAREDNTSETGYRSKVSRVDALAKKVVNETDYSQLQTTDKKIIGAINEVNTKASQFDNMTATASGSIATFDNGGDDIPLKSCVVEVASGNSECNIVNISDQTKKTYFDGLLNGTYNYCDLGDFSWSTTSQDRWYSNGISSVVKAPLSSSTKCGLICTKYDDITADETYLQNEGLAIGTNGLILIYDGDLVGKTSAQVQTALTGVKLIYPLATPITPTITEEQFNELCTAFGINYNSYNIPFGITTSDNGTLDVITGELTVGGTTTQLTGIKPTTFSGDNNFSADTGDISLEYFTNKADSIAELIKAFVL